MGTIGRDQRRQDRAYIRDLSALVAAWDPIGLVGGGAPLDEYDCLLAPIVSALRQGLPTEDLARVLGDRVRDHFGADAVEADRFAAELTAWHQSRRPASD